MPRQYNHIIGSRRRRYNNEQLQQAVEEVQNGRMSLRFAADRYDVPRATLSDAVLRRHTGTEGGQSCLDEDLEIVLANNLCVLADWGYPLSTVELRVMVKDYLNLRGITIPRFRDNMPGREWAFSFLQRRRQHLTVRASQNINKTKCHANLCTMDEYFDNLSVELSGVDAANIVNYDETCFADNPGAQRCIYRRGTKNANRLMHSSKASTSVMFACSGSGEILPPYVVFQAEHMQDRWFEGGPRYARYNRTKSGWFDSVCFTDWFKSVALTYFRHRPGRKILIGDNLASHFSEEVVTTCTTNNIGFLCLPTNSTHLCQPLDVSVV